MRSIAIIPARSGSKGLKDKNIKIINGKPLMYWTIKAAIESNCFDEIFVSTDSENYKEIAIQCGASVPFLRSEINSGDKSSSWEVVKETLEKYKETGKNFDSFMLLQPTSPLRTAKDIQNAFELYKNSKFASVLSITEAEHSPLYCSTVSENLSLKKMCSSKYFNMSRQELPTYYLLNGAIYLASVKKFLKNNSIYKEKILGYKMSRLNSVDIDDELDFILAEQLLKIQTK